MKVLITGSNGYIGRKLFTFLAEKGVEVLTAGRSYECNYYLDLNAADKFNIPDVDVIVHLAGIAHKRNVSNECFENINNIAVKILAEKSKLKGIKRFIFMSTIGVNGSTSNIQISESDPIHPHNSYSESKAQAEKFITDICTHSSMDFVILRPPLVYDKDAPGNYRKLKIMMESYIPLPFKGIRNHRNFCSLENLLNVIFIALDHRNASNQVFLVCDDLAQSTAEFISVIGNTNKIRPFLFRFPVFILRIFFKSFAMSGFSDALLENLLISNKKAKKMLSWKPEI